MISNNQSILNVLRKFRRNLISSYVDKNYSPKEIMDELKKLKLNYAGSGESELQGHIISSLYKQWNEEKSIWEDKKQLKMPWLYTKEDESRFWSSYLANLSPNQAETLLKDMKEILSNVKQITTAAARITMDIDYIVSKVKTYEGEK